MQIDPESYALAVRQAEASVQQAKALARTPMPNGRGGRS